MYQEIKKEIESFGFSVVSHDFERPWGGFLVIDETQAQAFSDKFFEGLDVNTLKIGGKYLNTLEFLKGEKPEKLPSISATVANDYGSYEGSMSNHDKVIENVVKALKGEEPIMTSADEGAKVVEAIEKFYSSVR